MEITSLGFITLAIGSVFIFYLLNHRYRVGFLVLLSCGFIASYSYYLLIYVGIYTLINYIIGISIPDSKHKTALFRTGIFINLSQLIVLKYSSFAIDPIIAFFGSNYQLSVFQTVIVPIGISYFTLQGIGYLINIKMGWEKPEREFFNFLLFFIFYPKFLSGPIERSNRFLSQLTIKQSFNEQGVTDGLRLILFGLFKKLAIANQLAPFVTNFYSNMDSAEGVTIWILLLIQPLFLYFDFSGYTDIALGLGKTFGIELTPNFNLPFLAENVTTFWKRFHISLSSWFNDYVFKQVSFRYRKWGIYASVFAVLATWILFGIWHGAGWTFIFLGLLQALAILYEFFTKKWRTRLFSYLPGIIRSWSGRIITYLFYGGSLFFFFAPSLKSVFRLFGRLFNGGSFILEGVNVASFCMALIVTFLFMASEIIASDFRVISDRIQQFWLSQRKRDRLIRWTLYFSVIAVIIVLSNEVQEFIYFQF